MMTLYEITDGLAVLARVLDEDLDYKQREEAEAMVAALLDGMLPAKVESYCRFMATLKLEAEAISKEEDRLAKRRKAREELAGRLKERLRDGLERAGVDRIETPTITVALQASPPSVKVLDEQQIPWCYWQPQQPKLDRSGILQALKSGQTVSGCEMSQSRHVRVR